MSHPIAAARPPLTDPLPDDPGPILADWIAEAAASGRYPDPTAFALATVDPDGRPAARMVLGRGFDPRAVHLEFHTHRSSRKARAVARETRGAAVLYFHAESRQARLEGPVTPLDDAASDVYFATRPPIAQLAAWSSAQGEPIASRAALVERWREAARRFGLDPDALDGAPALPRPPHWGGYRLTADRVELWIAREGRLHDRAEWTRTLGAVPGPWCARRLQP